ncbi:tol-pal system protein YbgF [Litorivivens lipolytica]|uniref:Cell division coordinator CpoB n=1 Tax=Litorivivens lipolytica TaxID=1524264 RepID=A0A7W4Z6Z2_9GAMM|nr:tol-pal system protein YbgF [Litorivivens lipolytica]MBB3047371.1 tol-pal system protein YbgF [Litorivivens lipolytica]
MNVLKYLMPAAAMLSAQLWAQAPIYDATQPPAGRAPAQAVGEIPTEQSLQMEIYSQLKTLQREMMELRGIVEEQGHEIRTLKQQSLDRYIELDRRIGGAGGSASSRSSGSSSNKTVATGTVPVEEVDAYREAYELVKAKQFEQAIAGFEDFLQRFPQGNYAPNAIYWTGELQLVKTPRNLKAAEAAFSSLLKQYPDHSKVPDAMYKLGKVHFLSGNKPASKKILSELIAKHGDSNRSAIKFARQFLQDNF